MRIAVAGAGLIGRRHIALVDAEATLSAVVDPAPEAEALAREHGAAWFPSLHALLARQRPDGVVVATPNQLHVEGGLACVEAGVAVLIEKPIADDLDEARRLVAAVESSGVPVLVGHHRRHNPIVGAAKRAIEEGQLGSIVAVHASCWFHKPANYFDVAWRREPGAGPVLVNLIHDIDTLRYLCGEIVSVQASESNAARGNAIEDSAVLLLRFRSGALAAITVSDTISAPWSWELTAAENSAYPTTGQSCYQIGGTSGSISLPDLTFWRYAGEPNWWLPIDHVRLVAEPADPLAAQMRHFIRVVGRQEAPLVSAREGLETLRVVTAAKRAARTGSVVDVASV